MKKWVYTTDEIINHCKEKIKEVNEENHSDYVKEVILKQWENEIERLESNRDTRGEP
jgi:hypothetical protein